MAADTEAVAADASLRVHSHHVVRDLVLPGVPVLHHDLHQLLVRPLRGNHRGPDPGCWRIPAHCSSLENAIVTGAVSVMTPRRQKKWRGSRSLCQDQNPRMRVRLRAILSKLRDHAVTETVANFLIPSRLRRPRPRVPTGDRRRSEDALSPVRRTRTRRRIRNGPRRTKGRRVPVRPTPLARAVEDQAPSIHRLSP